MTAPKKIAVLACFLLPLGSLPAAETPVPAREIGVIRQFVHRDFAGMLRDEGVEAEGVTS
jgi:hypothetical protein